MQITKIKSPVGVVDVLMLTVVFALAYVAYTQKVASEKVEAEKSARIERNFNTLMREPRGRSNLDPYQNSHWLRGFVKLKATGEILMVVKECGTDCAPHTISVIKLEKALHNHSLLAAYEKLVFRGDKEWQTFSREYGGQLALNK